ncbi:MAG: ATP-dependent DNA helicase RecG [Bacteroidales bacterium]|nr:ATP-dependent DNA helicase RecG [Bacteroidales bacterium]
MDSFLQNDITYLKGMGPKRADLLKKELGIFTVADLLRHYPYKYIDRSKIYKIAEINSTLTHIQLQGRITDFRQEGPKYKKRLIAAFSDNSGSIELVWFQGIKWVEKSYEKGIEYIVFGRPAMFGRKINIAHPEIELASAFEKTSGSALQPQYSTTEKLKTNYINSKTIQKLITSVLQNPSLKIRESLPEYLVNDLKLHSLQKALYDIHLPSTQAKIKKAELRLKFEELFLLQLKILKQKYGRSKHFKGYVFKKVGDIFNRFYSDNLTFELTGSQKKVMHEIRSDLGSGKQMNRLLQGDVGSGKTLVALMSILIALDNGYQTCIMAPTEVLAAQHFHTITNWIVGLGIQVKLLTGSSKKKERDTIFENLQNGSLQILIGTHALLEDPVQFRNLGLVIIDEQHRFGVAQRARLWKKSSQPPHVLVMTATPIPRTLAMTVYGDLDVSVIDEMPPGRKPVQTYHYFESKRLAMYGFLKKLVDRGQQVYIVYPLIEESEKLDYIALEDGYAGVTEFFPPPDYTTVCVHGKMKTEEKDFGMRLFKEGKAHIMVATTVIEVGVDIPNASIMVIESAERFGLSQLHQLRGRVGRGNEQSYCIMMTGYKLSNEAKKRIETMVNTTDGFEIAEADMKLRGPGDIEGTQQSGVPFDLKISNLVRDGQILQFARDVATRILDQDPELSDQKNSLLNKQISNMKSSQFDWSTIS